MRKHWILCTIIGIAAAILSSFVLKYSPADGGNFHPGYGKPVTAFEFAHSPEDVALVFGEVNGPARSGRIDGMRKGVYADFPFIIAFGSFLFVFFLAAFKQTGLRVWLIFGSVGIIAAASDAIEDIILLGILNDPIAAPLVSVLAVPVYMKFTGLAVTNIAAGVFLTKQRSLIWKAFGSLVFLSGIAVIIGLILPRQLVWILANAVAIGWIAMLIYAVTQSLRSNEKTRV